MAKELWRIVPSAPYFLASDEGRIMVAPYIGQMPNGGSRHYGGEPHFGVWSKTDKRFITVYKGKTYKVHRLVCEAFKGPAPAAHVCMHLDEDSANNKPENLEWGTQKENLNAPKYIASVRKRPRSALCKCCKEEFEPKSQAQTFCSVPCSSSFNNKSRSGQAMEWR